MDPFSFASSEQLNLPLAVRIVRLDGKQKDIPFSTLVDRPDLRYIGSNLSAHSDLFVTVQLFADSKPLTIPVQTPYRPFKNERKWGDWLSLPINYSSLPLSAQLAITVWDLAPNDEKSGRGHCIPFGGTTLPLFDKDHTLHKGRQACVIHRHKEADGLASSTTPALPPPQRKNGKAEEGVHGKKEAESKRLLELLKKHEMGEIPAVNWLDQLVFRTIEKQGLIEQPTAKGLQVNGRSRRSSEAATMNGISEDEDIDEENFVLHVELPRFDFPIVFSDFEYPPPPISTLQNSQTLAGYRPPPIPSKVGHDFEEFGGRIVKIYDPEVGNRDNPAENKHRRLVRGQRSGAMDRDLRPNARVRDELNSIMSYTPNHVLLTDEKDLVWKYRHYLTRDKRALTKFVKSVSWQDNGEARQAVDLLSKWTEIDVDDALELLGPTFDNTAVRAYAVDRLRKSDDDELVLYLLQLVQALKFEAIQASASSESAEAGTKSSLARFLIERAAHSFMLGNYFHWYLMVECSDVSEYQSADDRKLFAKVEYDFMLELERTPEGKDMRKTLLRQATFVHSLSQISDLTAQRTGLTIPKKIEQAKNFLANPKNELISIDPPMPLPLDPSVLISGLYPEQTSVFKSSLSPLKVVLRTTSGTPYPLIFKTGDDLRQDQLVVQVMTLMDQLLRKENLDLKLSPYKILATSQTAGAVQFVQSETLASIASKYRGQGGPIMSFLRQNNPDSTFQYGIRKEAIDTYIKSTAGYSVITFVLGIGDRHLDNLLLSPSGHFFHADFGYILGRDPKPFAPLMKLSAEMVDGMGGPLSDNWRVFKQYCFTCFTALRKQSGLVQNLFKLMEEANIPDMRDAEGKGQKCLEDRFMLGMGEEQALRELERVLDDSVTAIFPVIIDRLHGVVQAFRT